MKRIIKRGDLWLDLIGLGGLGVMCYGLSMVSMPLMLSVLGGVLMVGGFYGARKWVS